MGHTRRAVTQVATNTSPVCSEECLYIWSTRVGRRPDVHRPARAGAAGRGLLIGCLRAERVSM